MTTMGLSGLRLATRALTRGTSSSSTTGQTLCPTSSSRDRPKYRQYASFTTLNVMSG